MSFAELADYLKNSPRTFVAPRFSIDAAVRIQGDNREGVERLLRGHRREALVVLGPPSPSSAFTPWAE